MFKDNKIRELRYKYIEPGFESTIQYHCIIVTAAPDGCCKKHVIVFDFITNETDSPALVITNWIPACKGWRNTMRGLIIDPVRTIPPGILDPGINWSCIWIALLILIFIYIILYSTVSFLYKYIIVGCKVITIKLIVIININYMFNIKYVVKSTKSSLNTYYDVMVVYNLTTLWVCTVSYVFFTEINYGHYFYDASNSNHYLQHVTRYGAASC